MRRRELYKLRLDGMLDWEEYQETIEEEFIGWEEEVRELEQELGGGGIAKEVWSRWKERVIAAEDNRIGRKKVTEGQRDDGQGMWRG